MPRASAHHAVPQDRLADHLPALRAKLEHQRQFRLEQLTELKAMVGDTATPGDAANLARRDVTVNVAAAARQALAAIDIALALMTRGGYGRCHADIPLHLLQVIPASRLCLDCRRHRKAADISLDWDMLVGEHKTSRTPHISTSRDAATFRSGGSSGGPRSRPAQGA